MKFVVYFRVSKRVSFITDNESLAIMHANMLNVAGESIYDFQPMKEADEYEVPFIR